MKFLTGLELHKTSISSELNSENILKCELLFNLLTMDLNCVERYVILTERNVDKNY